MANVRIKCPSCGELLSADDKYLRYMVSCGCCHSTFIFDSICLDGNEGTIPVFPPYSSNPSSTHDRNSECEAINVSFSKLDSIKTGQLAKAIITYVLEQHLCDEAEIKQLSDSAYTLKKFHFKYPLLQIFPEHSIDKDKLITKGHNRYYQNPVVTDGQAIFVCKEWFDYNRKALLSWGLTKGLTIEKILSLISIDKTSSVSKDNLVQEQDISKISGDGRGKNNTYLPPTTNASFFKVFNKSVFVIGITIPNDLRQVFLSHLTINELSTGIPHRVSVKVQGQSYDAYILKANQKNGCYFWRLQWSKGAPIAVFLQQKYKNIYSILEANPRAIIPSNYGIVVTATDLDDNFELQCIVDDISEEQKHSLLNQDTYQAVNDNSEDIVVCETEENNALTSSVRDIRTFSFISHPNDLSYCKPVNMAIGEENFNINTWKELLIKICNYLYENKKDYILLLVNEKYFKASPGWCFKTNPDGLNSPYKMDDNLWFTTCLSTNSIISLCLEMLTFCEYPLERISVSYCLPSPYAKKRKRKSKDNIADEQEESFEESELEANATSGNSDFDEILERWGEDNL